MRANKILSEELERAGKHIEQLLEDNSRLTAALLAATGNQAAAAAMRPVRDSEPRTPTPRPMGL